MTTAIKVTRFPRFSFRGVNAVGEEFVHSCLAQALFFAAGYGHPAVAVDLDPQVSAQIDRSLRAVGALLPDHDRDRVLGSSNELRLVLQALREGKKEPEAVAPFAGSSAQSAEAQLAVLDHWGLGQSVPIAGAPRLEAA